MQLGIRAKMIGILIVASMVPVATAIVALQTVGYRQQVQEKGKVQANEARLLAENLRLAAAKEIGTLRDLVRFSGLATDLAALNREVGVPDAVTLSNEVARIESAWSGLRANQAWVAASLTNDMALRLRRFQTTHPIFAEILVTDVVGRLVAATGKSSDYFQADETWWQQGALLPAGQAWVGGLSTDESAGVFSVDIALSVRVPGEPDQRLQGVVKAVVNAARFFSSFALQQTEGSALREVVRSDGRIVMRLFDADYRPSAGRLPPETVSRLLRDERGIFRGAVASGEQHMIGHAPLRLLGVVGADGVAIPSRSGTATLQVLVHQRTSVVLAPIRRQVALMTVLGLVGVVGCGLLGLYVAQVKILRPLEALRGAAHAVAARVEGQAASDGARVQVSSAAELLAPLEGVRTGDEIQSLAQDFRQMASRVLRYQEHLQEEIAAKTAEIRRDLDMAREFQEALLPSAYPEVPSGEMEDRIGLQFCHVYRPASTVGGDFFDIIKLSDHRAGILVADVMGHGARSALVTAIIRTLLQSLVREAGSPADLLARLNAHFCSIVGQTEQTLFVSAFYMVADTQSATLEFSSAGHPSPLAVHRRTGEVVPLFTRLSRNPALGLFSGATYSVFHRRLDPDELFLLFTDGLLEAQNEEQDTEFGVERVVELVRARLDEPLGQVIQAVMDGVAVFAGERPLADDICVVGMEVLAREGVSQGAVGGRVGVAV